jgi:Domain of unknown function (DUF4265)
VNNDLQSNCLVKVRFAITPDSDGFPPLDVELLSAKPLGSGRFQVYSCPFFTRGVAYGDIVTADLMESAPVLSYVGTESHSGRESFCIILLDNTEKFNLIRLLKASSFFFEHQVLGTLTLFGVSSYPDEEWDNFYTMLQQLQCNEKLSVAKLTG